MINWLRRLFEKPQQAETPQCVWLEIGTDNPFDVRVLDVRPVTQTMLSVTRNKDLAQSFVDLRHNDGSDLPNVEMPDHTRVSCDLEIPVSEPPEDGPLFKAAEMEDKWDIYTYESVLYFTRSWSGTLIYKAPFSFSGESLNISEIACHSDHVEKADQDVYFLIVSHALGRPFPNPIPDGLENEAEQIASYSFNKFGRNSLCATYSDVTNVSTVQSDQANDR